MHKIVISMSTNRFLIARGHVLSLRKKGGMVR